MAQSSSSGSVANLQADPIPCKKCGRLTSVFLSRSERNPGRVFYCCPDHGFAQWVIKSRATEDTHAGRDFRQPDFREVVENLADQSTPTELTADAQGYDGVVQNSPAQTPITNSSNMILALTILNMFFVVVNLVILLIHASEK